MEILLTVVIVSILLGLAFLGLAIQIIIKKNHKFPNTHIGGNKAMEERGITCAQTWDKAEQRKAKKENRFKNLKLFNDKNAQ